MQAQAPNTVVLINAANGPNILVRLLWFVFLGMWLGSIVTFVGYALCVTVIGLPLGLALLNNLPKIMTLRAPTAKMRASMTGGMTTVRMGAKQVSLLIRIPYYLLIGWWLGGIWLAVAWLLSILWWVPPFLCMALAFWMFDRVPAVMTLRQN